MAEFTFKPLLATTYEQGMTLTRWPYAVSAKLDGIRCLGRGGVAYSRNLKPIRNEYVQSYFKSGKLDGLDGELVVGAAYGEGVYNRTNSGVMSKAGEPDFGFYVFDCFLCPDEPWKARADRAQRLLLRSASRVLWWDHVTVHDEDGLRRVEEAFLTQQYEGVMLRDPEAPYKFGRATPLSGELWKLKRFRDGEAIVQGLEEAEENTNEAFRDALGRTKRSTAKAGKRGKNMVGTILAVDVQTGELLRIGPGTMTHRERTEFWADPSGLVNKVIHYRVFDYGKKDKSRFPLYYGLREDL